MVTVPTLTDGVVVLRAHHDDDVDACLEQSTDPLSQRWTRVPVPYSRDDAKRFIRDAMPGGWVTDQEWGFAVEAVDDGGTTRYAGTVSLRNEGPGRAEIAYGAHPWARGRGIVERALRLLLEWGFAERDLETVIWWAQEGNWASRRTAWKLGFSCVGAVGGWLDQRETFADAWVGSLGRGDEQLPRHPWLTAPVVHGRRVVLRPLEERDLPRVVEACSDERVAYWLGTIPSPYTEDSARRFLIDRRDAMARGTTVHWAIVDPSTDVLLASTSLFGLDSPMGAEIGYWSHPEARGRGVVSEAVGLVVRHAFIDVADGGLGLGKVRLVAAAENAASRRVAEVNGFREVGVERAATHCRDGVHDAAIYDLLVDDLRRPAEQ
jgi:RimJ/RimL family protein N-acetyltransferase